MMTDAEYKAYISGLKEGDIVHVYGRELRGPKTAEPLVVQSVLKTRVHIKGYSVYRTGRNAGQEWPGESPRIIIPPDDVAAIQAAHAEWKRQREIRQRLWRLALPGNTREKIAENVANLRAQAESIEQQAATLTEEEWKILSER